MCHLNIKGFMLTMHANKYIMYTIYVLTSTRVIAVLYCMRRLIKSIFSLFKKRILSYAPARQSNSEAETVPTIKNQSIELAPCNNYAVIYQWAPLPWLNTLSCP
jgi:hypothetical protein